MAKNSCRINRASDGSIISIKAENGKDSLLYKELLSLSGGDQRAALELYAISQTDEFKEVTDIQKTNARAKITKAIRTEKTLLSVEDVTVALQDIAKESPEKVEKILGEDVVYHGTKQQFDEFDDNKIGSTDDGWYGKGFYFHSDRDRGGYGDIVKAAKIDLKKPIVLPVQNSGEYLYDLIGKEAGLDESFRSEGSQNIIRKIGSDNFTKIAKRLGYDGVIVNYVQGTKEIVAFDKGSIKQSNPKTIAEAYHKAKKDGSNPELVKAVESLLVTEETVNFTKEGDNYFAKVEGKTAGRIRTIAYKDGFKIDSSIVYDGYQNLGIGNNLYKVAIQEIQKLGKPLYSDDKQAEYAEKIWNKLVKEGIAEKTGKSSYVIKPFGPSFDINGEPADPKTIVQFAQNLNEKPLTESERLDVQNAVIGLGFKNSQVAFEALHKLFNESGVFLVDRKKMKDSGLYNSYEIDAIVGSPEIQANIKETLTKLRNTESFDVEYPERFVFPESTELNSLGKQKVTNPFQKQKEIAENVAGLYSVIDIPGALDTMSASKFEQDSLFSYDVFFLMTNNKIAPVQTIVDNELVTKKQDIAEIIPLILDTKANPKMSSDIDYIMNKTSAEVWNENLVDVARLLRGIKRRAKSNGLNLQNLESKVYTHSREQILGLLNSMEDMLEEPSEQNIRNFSDQYNEMFEYDQEVKELITSDSKNDVVIHSTKNEYDLFKDNNVVRKSGDIYRKVQPQSLTELYEAFFANKAKLPTNVMTIEDLVAHVQSNINKLDLQNFQADTEVLEKMYLYKTFFNFPLNTGNGVVSTSDLTKLTYPAEYLQMDFIKEFNQWILATDNTYFGVDESGIYLKQNDSISKQEAIASLTDSVRDKLAQYDTLSKNLNLGLTPTQTEAVVQDAQRDKRLEVVNNPQVAPKLSGEYSYIKDGVLATKNETETFVRTPQGVYEMIYEMGNVKFYGKLPDSNRYFKLSQVEKPLSNIDFSEYQYLETSPEIWKKAKNYYSKSELEEINKEHFECKV